ncbi:MAG: crotonase/enoyl-CoA hydratase family protein [Gammaproteobacteria bacterium]|nr:crotonase/enoyl-CoA hydratase family protein [Gammaproteobacteria bacterium]
MSTVRFAGDTSFRNYAHLQISVDSQAGIAWMDMQPSPRPCFTPRLLEDIRNYQMSLTQYRGRLPHEGELVPIQYQVLGSTHPDIFNLGGDLEQFVRCIETRNAEWLRQYGRACIDSGYRSHTGYGLDITTISLVRGEALGGGFEAALSRQVMIAERNARFGLPEVLFNLFPGMGAYQYLAQRIGPALAERMILSGRVYDAEELHEMGVVDVLAEAGAGIEAVHEFIRSHQRRRNARLAVQGVRALSNPVRYEDLIKVCDMWVDAAMRLTERDLRTMKRLIRGQDRLDVERDTVRTPALVGGTAAAG